MGLSFSVPAGRPIPRSLANIAQELRSDTGETLTSGDLTPWQEQGVMLLNRVLTVGPGSPGSHRGRGWEEVTERAIRALAERGGPLVAILWGRDARALRPLLGGVPAMESPHPSPLSASSGFFGSRPFSRANAALEAQGSLAYSLGRPTRRLGAELVLRRDAEVVRLDVPDVARIRKVLPRHKSRQLRAGVAGRQARVEGAAHVRRREARELRGAREVERQLPVRPRPSR